MSFDRYEHERCVGIVAALKACKQFLRNGKELGLMVIADPIPNVIKEFNICFAINSAAAAGLITRRQADYAINHIMRMLGGHYSVGTWLNDQIDGLCGNPQRAELLQDYRHRWVDAMIVEFSNEKKWNP